MSSFFCREYHIIAYARPGEEKIYGSSKKSLANLQVYIDQSKGLRAESINTK